eukprot:CAMPEP_0194350620 /NCGR_PEP_ID=MMETSP0171-20130528/107735_1 /TAXON_ID=218684 /ORGANISM="Corethron pennatum, Strain L29A3" /LENGTH=181 /DNA_ID=CAMNT_0039118181 /DNA_START=526 /DNA_END=1071 /DNA_ORIENTATION=+
MSPQLLPPSFLESLVSNDGESGLDLNARALQSLILGEFHWEEGCLAQPLTLGDLRGGECPPVHPLAPAKLQGIEGLLGRDVAVVPPTLPPKNVGGPPTSASKAAARTSGARTPPSELGLPTGTAHPPPRSVPALTVMQPVFPPVSTFGCPGGENSTSVLTGSSKKSSPDDDELVAHDVLAR